MMLPRRHFLLTGLAGVAAQAAKPPARHIDRSRLSAISDEIARTPAAAIAFAQQYRMQWLELRAIPGEKIEYAFAPEDRLRQAAKEFADGGVKISFLNSSLLKFGLPDTEPVRRTPEKPEAREARLSREKARFEARFDDLNKAIRAAHILNVKDVRIFTFSRVAEPAPLYPRIADIIGEMSKTAEREGVRLLVENETSCNVAGCAETTALLKMLPSQAIGINWDVLNGVAYEKPYPDGYNLLPKSRILNVQAKGKTLLDYPEHLDWTPILRGLERDGYQGQIGLETHIFGEGQIKASHASIQELIRLTEPA